MKYVFVSTTRPGGSAKENEEAVPRVLEMLAKWTPPASMTIHQFVTRVDGGGGFGVVETDNPADLLEATSKFGPYFEYQIFPVLDMADAVPTFQQGVEFRKSIT
jgi:hypothetical protein